MSLVYPLDDLVPRELVRRIIDSDRTKQQKLDSLDAIPTQEQMRKNLGVEQSKLK